MGGWGRGNLGSGWIWDFGGMDPGSGKKKIWDLGGFRDWGGIFGIEGIFGIGRIFGIWGGLQVSPAPGVSLQDVPNPGEFWVYSRRIPSKNSWSVITLLPPTNPIPNPPQIPKIPPNPKSPPQPPQTPKIPSFSLHGSSAKIPLLFSKAERKKRGGGPRLGSLGVF